MSEEPQPIGPAIDETILRAFPEALAQYDELKEARNAELERERRAYKQAATYLRRRRAGPEQHEELRAKREAELRRIEEEFRQKVRGLVEGLMRAS